MFRSGILLNRLALFSLPNRPRRIGLWAYLALARQRHALSKLDAVRLADLGLTPDQARAEAERPIWDVPDYWTR